MTYEPEYRVEHFKNNTYEVMELVYSDEYSYGEGWESVFKGTLTDCEAFIRLKQGGYM